MKNKFVKANKKMIIKEVLIKSFLFSIPVSILIMIVPMFLMINHDYDFSWTTLQWISFVCAGYISDMYYKSKVEHTTIVCKSMYMELIKEKQSSKSTSDENDIEESIEAIKKSCSFLETKFISGFPVGYILSFIVYIILFIGLIISMR